MGPHYTLINRIHPKKKLEMILDNEREVQREFNAVYNHLVELKYALDQKKDSRSNRILGLIRRMEELIHESEVD